jgi:N-acyl-D-amino-acid deacylase
MKPIHQILFVLLLNILIGCSSPETYDILIKNGQIADGSGQPIYLGDIGINADTIVAIGKLEDAKGAQEIDASGLVVAP